MLGLIILIVLIVIFAGVYWNLRTKRIRGSR
jgi:hypothetical protein